MPDSPPQAPQSNPTRTFGSLLPADPDLTAGTRLGDWIIEAKIGEGGMGTVYAAVHAEIGKHAAIKVVRAALCATELGGERFVQEARIVNQIEHPNIVDIFHVGRLADGRPYLVMELLRGRNLADRLAASRMPAAESIDVLLQLCAALTAAHARGVIHRDLKPDNVFIVDTHHGAMAKLVDWGIAKLTDADQPSSMFTRTGVLIGTPQYISPEQARGRPIDASTDIYSLGVIAYELFLEEPPFCADNVADLIAMHLREPVPPPSDVWPDIPPALDSLLVRMLAKEPAGRPPLDEVTRTLVRVRAELDNRTEHHRKRLAAGSQPPPMGSAQMGSFDHGRTDTMPSSLPAVIAASLAASPSRGLQARQAQGSGPVAVFDPARPVPRAPSPTLQDLAPPRRSRLLLAAALTAAVSAAIVATVLMAGRSERRRVEPAAAEPAPAEPAPAELAAVGPAAAGSAPAGPAIEAAPAAGPVITPAPAAEPSVVASGLDLRVAPRSATIRIDGAEVSSEHGRLEHALAPGRHELVVDARGHRPLRRTIEIVTGATLELEVRLEPIASKPDRRSKPRPGADTVNPDGTIDPFE